jgi:putative FmdB family regulatory protein
MPIYEYVCQKCGNKFEKFLRSCCNQGEVLCPKCGAAEVKKALSLFGVGGGKASGSSASGGSCAPTGG